MKNLFTNKNNQLRSGWRIVIVLITSSIAVVILSILIGIIIAISSLSSLGIEGIRSIDKVVSEALNSKWLESTMYIIQESSMIFMVILFWKVFDRKPIKNIGLINIKLGYKSLFIGLLFGTISITTVFAIILLKGDIELSSSFMNPSFTSSLIFGFIVFVFVGFGEEIFSRGYCMTVLNQTNNRWVAVIVSSLIFSLLHVFNPNISLLGVLNIFLVGMLFAFMTIKSGSIWMPIGYHITWNYFQGNIFGFQVSGTQVESLYNIKLLNINILNGGNFGPEGGLIVTLILILGFIFTWKFIGNNKRFIYAQK